MNQTKGKSNQFRILIRFIFLIIDFLFWVLREMTKFPHDVNKLQNVKEFCEPLSEFLGRYVNF